MSSSLTLKLTNAMSQHGVSCEASNPLGSARHVFHFGPRESPRWWDRSHGAGGELQAERPSVLSPQWPPRPPRPE